MTDDRYYLFIFKFNDLLLVVLLKKKTMKYIYIDTLTLNPVKNT